MTEYDDGGLPLHLPFPVTAEGQGPADHDDMHHWTCWCGNPECTWAIALSDQWNMASAEAVGASNPECAFDGCLVNGAHGHGAD